MEIDPPTIVTLINGTFARDATWVDPEAPLALCLRSHLGDRTIIQPLRWSGGNSSAARHEGAEKLAAHLATVARDHPTSPHFLIAHSHGGNVALQALRTTTGSIRGLVCLNTPFLHSQPRSFTFLSLLGFYSFTPVLPAFLLVIYMYLTRYKPMYPDRYVWPLVRAAIWGCLWLPVGFLLVRPYERMVAALEKHFQSVYVRAESQLVPDVAPGELGPPRSPRLRGVATSRLRHQGP